MAPPSSTPDLKVSTGASHPSQQVRVTESEIRVTSETLSLACPQGYKVTQTQQACKSLHRYHLAVAWAVAQRLACGPETETYLYKKQRHLPVGFGNQQQYFYSCPGLGVVMIDSSTSQSKRKVWYIQRKTGKMQWSTNHTLGIRYVVVLF